MINILKNKETKITLIICVLLTGLMIWAAKSFDIDTGMALALLGAALIAVWYIMSIFRYKSMQKMIGEIDEILHGNHECRLSDYEEGELSILKNEISKMTLMLRNQAEQLGKDKLHLADSLADISHQIRTPLTSLNILAATISKEAANEDKCRESAFEIKKLLSRIDWLVTSLLKLAKMDAGTIILNKKEEKLSDMVDSAITPLDIMFDLKDIRIHKQTEGCFLGDMPWTCEAVSNILKNCAEHIQDGGDIYITTVENAIYSEIVIKDNGTGIAVEDLPYIFERFYKGKNSGNDSYGIGLALSRMIINNQNGTIKAENNKEGGACFTIRFYKGRNITH